MNKDVEVILIGYSGHADVVHEIFDSMAYIPVGYCDISEQIKNPYNLPFLGNEDTSENTSLLKKTRYFVSIGDNNLRKRTTKKIFNQTNKNPVSAIHQLSSVSKTAQLGYGVMVSNGCIVNACAQIGDGVVCNTQSVIEHECNIGSFCHIAPGAILCGNVNVGSGSLIGARAVVKPGISIGENVVIGAGTVIIKDIPDNVIVVGNPQKII